MVEWLLDNVRNRSVESADTDQSHSTTIDYNVQINLNNNRNESFFILFISMIFRFLDRLYCVTSCVQNEVDVCLNGKKKDRSLWETSVSFGMRPFHYTLVGNTATHLCPPVSNTIQSCRLRSRMCCVPTNVCGLQVNLTETSSDELHPNNRPDCCSRKEEMPIRNDLKKQYKKPPSTLSGAREIRISLGHEQRERRRKRRIKDFEENRKENPLLSQNDKPKTKLSDWKAEREKKKKASEPKKKPPFVIGIVRHHIYSPVSTSNVASTGQKKTVEGTHKKFSVKRRITKATEKRLLAKAAEAKRKTHASKKPATNDKVESDVNKRESFAPPNHLFNPPAGLPHFASFSESCKYTSTPFSANVKPLTPLLTMKVSQLYNKSTLHGTMLFGQTPEQTPRKSSTEKSKRKSLRIKACKTNLDDYLAKTASYNSIIQQFDKLKIDQNSGASLTEKNKSDNLISVKCIHTEGKCEDSASDSSVQAMIENTGIEKSNTLVSKQQKHRYSQIKQITINSQDIDEAYTNVNMRLIKF